MGLSLRRQVGRHALRPEAMTAKDLADHVVDINVLGELIDRSIGGGVEEPVVQHQPVRPMN